MTVRSYDDHMLLNAKKTRPCKDVGAPCADMYAAVRVVVRTALRPVCSGRSR